MKSLLECERCLFDEDSITGEIDSNRICTICKNIDSLKLAYGTGTKRGENKLSDIVLEIKNTSRWKKYDCLIGVSGGTDSSYLLYLAKEKLGLRPLAFHYDNTWNTSIATMNIYKMTQSLGIDFESYVVDNLEIDDIYRSTFLADVPELDASTDLAFAYMLRRTAKRYNIQYIFEGHSFLEEGITPLNKNYFDGKYIRDIHKTFGNVKMQSYPLMTLSKFIFNIVTSKVRIIRPFWYLDYNKSDAKQFLHREFDWKDYGGHHLENRLTSFLHNVYLPEKFQVDMRSNLLSAHVRKGIISKVEAKKILAKSPIGANEASAYFRKRLGFTEDQFEEIMKRPTRNWKEFKNYKFQFEILRPFFKIMKNKQRVTDSFYIKYCQNKGL